MNISARLVLISLVTSIVLCAIGLYGLPIKLQIAQHALISGLLIVYVFTTSLWLSFILSTLFDKVQFKSLLRLIVSIFFLLLCKWLVFGVYFISIAKYGVDNKHELTVDFYLRRVLSLQLILFSIVALWHIKSSKLIDIVLSATLAGLIVLLTIGSRNMMF